MKFIILTDDPDDRWKAGAIGDDKGYFPYPGDRGVWLSIPEVSAQKLFWIHNSQLEPLAQPAAEPAPIAFACPHCHKPIAITKP